MRGLPPGFRFGVATAAYQVEGATGADGRGESIWDRWVRSPENVIDGDTGAVACDHYRRWPEDVELMAELGVESYRFSIAWPRIQPSGEGVPNRRGLDFYRRLAEGLLARGIEPTPTLYHWDLPQALQDRGGWASRETAERFGEYAEIIAEGLGDLVGSWITVNEPWVIAFPGHAFGTKAPGLRDWATAVRVSHHVLLAHGWALDALRAGSEAEAGIALDLMPVLAASDSEPDRLAARRMDGHHNRWFLDAILRGAYPEDMLAFYAETAGGLDFIEPGDAEVIASPTDFLGVNYYRPLRIAAAPGEGPLETREVPARGPTTAMGWEVAPARFRDLLLRLRDHHGNPPVYITENGACFQDPRPMNGRVDDPERADYLRDHLRALGEANEAGADIRRYYVWTFLDNFEWEHGYSKRFGIVHVDFESQRRSPKASALWYRDQIRSARDGRKGGS